MVIYCVPSLRVQEPGVRVATIEAAGRAAVPFTTGLLVGIGESREDRLADLAAIAALHERYGHIQVSVGQAWWLNTVNTGM